MSTRIALAPACSAPTPAAASAQTLPAACTNGVGDTASLVSAINQANGAPGPDSVTLGAGCVYLVTPTGRASGSDPTRCRRSPATS